MCDIITSISNLSKPDTWMPLSSIQVWHGWLFLDESTIIYDQAALLGTDNIIWIRNTWFLLSKYVLSHMEHVTNFIYYEKTQTGLEFIKIWCVPLSSSNKGHTNNLQRIWKHILPSLYVISLGQTHSRNYRPWDSVSSQRVHFTGVMMLASEIIWREKMSRLTMYY